MSVATISLNEWLQATTCCCSWKYGDRGQRSPSGSWIDEIGHTITDWPSWRSSHDPSWRYGPCNISPTGSCTMLPIGTMKGGSGTTSEWYKSRTLYRVFICLRIRNCSPAKNQTPWEGISLRFYRRCRAMPPPLVTALNEERSLFVAWTDQNSILLGARFRASMWTPCKLPLTNQRAQLSWREWFTVRSSHSLESLSRFVRVDTNGRATHHYCRWKVEWVLTIRRTAYRIQCSQPWVVVSRMRLSECVPVAAA